MPEQLHAFDELSTREGFNRSLKHFKFISRVIGEFERRRNLADTLSECLADKVDRAAPGPADAERASSSTSTTTRAGRTTSRRTSRTSTLSPRRWRTWRAIDLVVAYFHPELGVVVVNPKNRAHWEGVRSLKRNELVTVSPAPSAKRTATRSTRTGSRSSSLSSREPSSRRPPR